MKPLWIIGTGGHAKVVIDTALASGAYAVMGCFDDDPGREGQRVLGVPIVGPATVDAMRAHGVEGAVIAIGSNQARKRMDHRLGDSVNWETLVHPSAILGMNVEIGAGSVIFAGVVVQSDTTIGRHAILNTGCTVDHDNRIGDFAQVCPGAHLAGNVQMAEGAFCGIGSSALPSVQFGEWSVLGAGGVAVTDVAPFATVVGIPARAIVGQQ